MTALVVPRPGELSMILSHPHPWLRSSFVTIFSCFLDNSTLGRALASHDTGSIPDYIRSPEPARTDFLSAEPRISLDPTGSAPKPKQQQQIALLNLVSVVIFFFLVQCSGILVLLRN